MAFYFDDHHDSLVIRWLDFVSNFPFFFSLHWGLDEMIHKLLLFLCRSTRTSRCSYLWYFPLYVDGNEGDGRQGGKTRRWGKWLILGFGPTIEIG